MVQCNISHDIQLTLSLLCYSQTPAIKIKKNNKIYWKETVTVHFHLSSKYIWSLNLIFTFILTDDAWSISSKLFTVQTPNYGNCITLSCVPDRNLEFLLPFLNFLKMLWLCYTFSLRRYNLYAEVNSFHHYDRGSSMYSRLKKLVIISVL